MAFVRFSFWWRSPKNYATSTIIGKQPKGSTYITVAIWRSRCIYIYIYFIHIYIYIYVSYIIYIYICIKLNDALLSWKCGLQHQNLKWTPLHLKRSLTVDIVAVQRVIHNLQIDPRILARFFSSGLFGYQCTLRRFHCRHHHGCCGHCAVWSRGACGVRQQPFLENAQESGTAGETSPSHTCNSWGPR